MSDDVVTFSFTEAEALCRAEAKRVLQLDASAIRYVRHDSRLFQDFCRVDFVFDAGGRAPMILTMLPLAERQADEHFGDDHIKDVARSGRVLDAIRLYRLKYAADLATAHKAVQAILEG